MDIFQSATTLFSIDKETQEFVFYMNASNRSQSLLASITLGRVIANSLPMVCGELDNFEIYYRTTWQLEVTSRLSAVNEILLIDVGTVQEYVFKFYKLRYVMMYPQKTVFCPSPETALVDFIGISRQLDKSTVDAIVANPTETMKLTNGFVKLVDQLKSQKGRA